MLNLFRSTKEPAKKKEGEVKKGGVKAFFVNFKADKADKEKQERIRREKEEERMRKKRIEEFAQI